MITLVLGGARSGKSQVAERLTERLTERLAAGPGAQVTYLATADLSGTDEEMRERVRQHRARRPPGWSTVEVGTDLPAVLNALAGPALVDSLGLWVAGCLAAGREADGVALCAALRGRSGPTVLVSEEVGLGVHPSSEAGRRFRDALGLVNQAVAAISGEVLLVVAGRVLPLERAP